MTTLLIDNHRTIPADRVARNYRDGIAALQERHWDVLYLDHDLGDFSGVGGTELSGYDVACWIETHPEHRPDRVEIIANSPVSRCNLEFVLRRIYRK